MLIEVGDDVILEYDLSHRPEGAAPLCRECGRPVRFIEVYDADRRFEISLWDWCHACHACEAHCLCPDE